MVSSLEVSGESTDSMFMWLKSRDDSLRLHLTSSKVARVCKDCYEASWAGKELLVRAIERRDSVSLRREWMN
jgi:hypothetical protein